MNWLHLLLTSALIACAACQSAPTEPATPPSAEPVSQAEPVVQTEPEREPLKAGIETLHFQIDIDAPVELVWQTVFSPETYTQWTEPFMKGAYFEGDWVEGERMLFLAPSGNGMVAEIAYKHPNRVMSIKHLGFRVNGAEDTTSPGVQAWAPAYEIYRFEPTDRGTRVSIEHDNLESMAGFMEVTWPKALAVLKEICESHQPR